MDKSYKLEMEKMTMITKVNKNTFENEVTNAGTPVLVDFFANWCGPCRMLSPVLEEIATKFDKKVKIVKVDVDESPELAMRYGISAVPTLILFKGTLVLEQLMGYHTAKDLEHILSKYANDSQAQPSKPKPSCGCCCGN
jgi:thioredoxin 1